MKQTETVSDEMLCAFLDEQLSAEERTAFLSRCEHEPELRRRLETWRQLDERIELAYQSPPLPRQTHPAANRQGRSLGLYAVAAALSVMAFGLGWQMTTSSPISGPTLSTVKDFEPAFVDRSPKILVHVNKLDDRIVREALGKTEEILRYAKKNKKPVSVEFVANAQGLAMLRRGSPYTEQIRSIKSQYDNVKFLACGIAMDYTRLKEGRSVELINDAKRIPAAIDQILDRLQNGWAYLKG